MSELAPILESLLFASQKPLTSKELREVLRTAAKVADESLKAMDPGEEPSTEKKAALAWKKVTFDEVDQALEALREYYDGAGRSFRLVCVAGAWQFVSLPEFSPWLRIMIGEKNRPQRLSQPALETLAIIAYRQPLTRAEMEQIRGVSVDGVLSTLVERRLVEKVGHADAPGRPATYGTTSDFLEYFGLAELGSLPAADELRRIPVERPEALLTADPGLETAGDEDASGEEQKAPDEAMEAGTETEAETEPNPEAEQKES